MLRMKSGLLCATVMATGFAGVAQAQIALPSAELRGAGATAVGTIHVGVMNCIGVNNFYGTNTGQTIVPVTPSYVPTVVAANNPPLDCSIDNIQPSFNGKYVGVGSGGGRNWWTRFANQLGGTTPTTQNPFAPPVWSNVQFAFSEGIPSATELTNYNTYVSATQPGANSLATNPLGNQAGPAIIIPLYVLPVAISYAQSYGVNGTRPLNFNVRSTNVLKDSAGNPIGGIRLTKAAYCGIFNGTITNWNDATLLALNSNQSYADVGGTSAQNNVEATRWASAAAGGGAPIRLVGRADNSGTSDVFTRHLAAVCPAFPGNRVTVNSGNLPYSTVGGPDIRNFLATSQYWPTGAVDPSGLNTNTTNSSSYAGGTQSLSGAYFNDATNTIQAAPGFPAGEQPGLFMVANGNTGVTAAIAEANNTLVVSALDPAVRLNGKVGYVSGEFVLPSPGATNFSAALQVGTLATSFVGATTTQANTAFGSVLPPQTTASSGAWNPSGDTRPLSRSNPRDWGLALYSTPTATLANPVKGYPITGPSFGLFYTCYAPDAPVAPSTFAVPAKRLQTAQLIGILLGTVTKKSNGTPLSVNTFRGTASTSLGILTQQNLSVPPTAWRNAINETFLKRSTQPGTLPSGPTTLGAQNLWIQSAAPTNINQFDGLGTNDILSNSACTVPAKGA
jgi:ABC-type phosphate transport system substrate-binding protein